MQRRRRAYVDTSVFGGTQDEEFCDPSIRFFAHARAGRYAVVLSTVTTDELADAPESVRDVLTGLRADGVERVSQEIEEEARDLAAAYLEARVVGPARWADALHVAIATVARVDLVLSWNFAHIVNYDRISGFNGVNALNGYPRVEIHSPLEVVYGDEDEDV